MEEGPDLPEAGTSPRRLNWPGILRGLVLPLAVLALIVGGLWYWQSRSSGAGHGPYGTVPLPAQKNATGKGVSPDTNRAGPDFLLERPGGGTLRLSDLQGHPVLLNFWASWCAPCRQEAPKLAAAYQKYQAQGLIVVGVDLQEADSKVLGFVREFGITYAVVIDRSGEVGDVWRIGGLKGLPTSYFIDSAGVVRYSYPGQLTDDLLANGLAKILPAGAG